MTDHNLGCVYIVAAPSGGGKTSLVKELVTSIDNIQVSISHTTRPIRSGEKDGADYFFVNDKTFAAMVNDNDFVEYAQVFGYSYGTASSVIKKTIESGTDIVLDIDWQGAQQIKHLFPDAVSIFILPPSLDVLKNRLKERKRDDEEVIKYRMQQAKEEMSHYGEFDYIIVNDIFDKAAKELQSIVIANRLKTKYQSSKQIKLLSFLLASE